MFREVCTVRYTCEVKRLGPEFSKLGETERSCGLADEFSGKRKRVSSRI